MMIAGAVAALIAVAAGAVAAFRVRPSTWDAGAAVYAALRAQRRADGIAMLGPIRWAVREWTWSATTAAMATLASAASSATRAMLAAAEQAERSRRLAEQRTALGLIDPPDGYGS